MRYIAPVLFLAWAQLCAAFYDSVIFSKQPMRKMTVEEVIEASGKVMAVGVKDFSLPGFSKYAQAYSAQISDGPLTSMKRIFANNKALPIENPLEVTANDAEAQQPEDGIKYIEVDILEELQKLLLHQKDLESYDAVIISSQNAFENELIRNKMSHSSMSHSSEVTFDKEPVVDGVFGAQKQGRIRQQLAAAPGENIFSIPVVLPPLNNTSPKNNTSCLLYMEGFVIIIRSSTGTSYLRIDGKSNSNYTSNPTYYDCNIHPISYGGNASFIIDVSVGSEIGIEYKLLAGTRIKLQLNFTGAQSNGYWYLNSTELMQSFNIQIAGGNLTVNNGAAVNIVNIGSVPRFNFACSQTQAAYFNTFDPNGAKVGIALRNFEVNLGLPKFGYYTTDCIGTFSPGTWMGIIVSLVCVAIVLFGYLMVQSVKTMDRLDDPKQKQIVISTRE